MMRYYFFIAILILVSCHSNQDAKHSEPKVSKDECFIYPSSIVDLKSTDLYDSARWFVYTWYCDQNYLSVRNPSDKKTFGELPIKFHDIVLKNDTLEINFRFLDSAQTIMTDMTANHREFLSGTGFNLKTRQKIYMVSPNGFRTTIKGGANRWEDSLQPEVLAYIKRDWDKLDDCFRALAAKKGLSK